MFRTASSLTVLEFGDHGKNNLIGLVIVDLDAYAGDCLKALVNVIHMSH